MSENLKTIDESYFGAELLPIEIVETEYGKIYVCKFKEDICLYNEKGIDSMDLSSIDIKEFEKALKENNEI